MIKNIFCGDKNTIKYEKKNIYHLEKYILHVSQVSYLRAGAKISLKFCKIWDNETIFLLSIY